MSYASTSKWSESQGFLRFETFWVDSQHAKLYLLLEAAEAYKKLPTGEW